MSDSAFKELDNDILLSIATGQPEANTGPGHDNDILVRIAQQEREDSIDTQSGAPAGVRAQVGAAQSQEDRLTTLRNLGYADAIPVEIFDPENGATKFGRGNFIFTNPETGQLTLFDEDIRLFGMPVPTLGDFADIGPEIAETIGAIGGGISGGIAGASAGTVAAPVFGTVAGGTAGFIAGEGAGSALAREAYISVLDFFGETEDSRTGLERAGDMAFTASINAAAGPVLSKIWRGVKFVGGAPVRYAYNAMSAGAEAALNRMVRTGVTNPTAGQVSGSPLINFIEAGLAMLPASTRIMKENAEQTIAQLDTAAKDLAEQYGGTRTTSEAAYGLMDSATAARARYDDTVNGMYSAVNDMIPEGLVSDARATTEFVERYIAAAKTATGSPQLNPALTQAQQVLKDAADGVLTYNRLKDFRTSLGQSIRSAESKGALTGPEAKVKELYGYVTRDLDELVARSDNADASLLYRQANEFVRTNMRPGGDMRFIDDVLRRGESEATGALRYAMSGAKDGAERIEKLRRQFTPEEFDVLAGYQLGKMGTPRASVAGAAEVGEGALKEGAEYVAEQGFSPNTFLTNWGNMSKEAKDAMFAGGKYDDLVPALDDLIFTIDRIGKTASQMANPSGTAKNIAALGFLGGMPGLSMMGMDGFTFGFAGLAGQYGGAKLMTNPAYVKWLTQGAEIAAFNPNAFGQHIRRLVQIQAVNPEIRDELRAVIQGLSQETIEPIPDQASTSQRQLESGAVDNEMAFRQVSTQEVSDKLMPTAQEMQARMASTQPAPNNMPLFEDLELAGDPSPMAGGFDPSMSPTIVPSASDREIAERMNARRSGIAGLV
jgi:hypothetical protein